MRKMLALTGAAFGLLLSANLTAPAHAGDVATRCGEYGCDQIHCHDDGDHCVRFSDYDSYYNGYVGGGYGSDYGGNYGGYDNYGTDDQVYNGAYGGSYYGGYGNYNGSYGGGDYGNGYYGGYANGPRLVCDSDGTRCYQSDRPYWDYHEYYRVHGYHWDR